MSGNGEGEFSTEGALTLSVDERSLSDARDTVEDELGDIEVSVSADTGGIAGGGGAASNAMDDLVAQGDTNISLDETRNELLRDIEDLLEQIALQTEGGGGDGGGLFRSPRGRGTIRDTVIGTVTGAATLFGLQQGSGTPGPTPSDGPQAPDTPTGAPDELPITLPDPFGEGVTGRSPVVADGAVSRQIAANRIGPDVGRQAGGALALAGVGAGSALVGAAGGLGSLVGGGVGESVAGALGVGSLGFAPGAESLPTGDLGALITEFFTERRSRAAAVDAFVQANPGIAETSLSTEAGQRSLTGGEAVATVDRGGGGVGTATSQSAALRDATLLNVFSQGGQLVARVRLNGQTSTVPVSQLPQPLREQALGRGGATRDRGGGGGGGGTSPRARSGATRRSRDDEDTAARVREDVSRAIEGRPTTGPRDRPGSSNTRL